MVFGHCFSAGFTIRSALFIGLFLLGVVGGYLSFDDAVDLFVEAVALFLLSGYALSYLLLLLLEVTHEFLLFGFAAVEFLLLLYTLGQQFLFGFACMLQLGTLDIEFLLFESPFRIARTLKELAELSPESKVAVIREATKLHEEILRGTAAELAALKKDWKGEIVVGLYPSQAEDIGNDDDE